MKLSVWDHSAKSHSLRWSNFSLQDSGQHLSVIDDCNDHMLTVWDWQKKSKIAEIKVEGFFFIGENI